MARYDITVNGESRRLEAEPDSPLLYVLRDQLGLHGPKFGCGLGQCGACTVHVDGQAIRSCALPVSALGDRRVTTIEGWDERPAVTAAAGVHRRAGGPVGYCINGMVMQAADLLERTPRPTSSGPKRLGDELCRCGTHQRIVRAVQRASGQSLTV